jgi:hypothetical protein
LSDTEAAHNAETSVPLDRDLAEEIGWVLYHEGPNSLYDRLPLAVRQAVDARWVRENARHFPHLDNDGDGAE